MVGTGSRRVFWFLSGNHRLKAFDCIGQAGLGVLNGRDGLIKIVALANRPAGQESDRSLGHQPFDVVKGFPQWAVDVVESCEWVSGNGLSVFLPLAVVRSIGAIPQPAGLPGPRENPVCFPNVCAQFVVDREELKRLAPAILQELSHLAGEALQPFL